MTEDYLAHHGVKGMKWGVRRYQNPDGSLTNAGKRRVVKQERKEASKNRSLLSDEELDRRIRRLEKEKRFKELTKSEVTPGRAYVAKTLDKYGNQAVSIAVGASIGGITGTAASSLTKEFLKSRGLVKGKKGK